jgi:hypothetical protein
MVKNSLWLGIPTALIPVRWPVGHSAGRSTSGLHEQAISAIGCLRIRSVPVVVAVFHPSASIVRVLPNGIISRAREA